MSTEERRPIDRSSSGTRAQGSRPEGMRAEGERRPRPEGMRAEGERRPRPEGMRAEGERRPRPEGARAEGERRPRPEGARSEGERRPRPDGARAEGERRPRPEGARLEGERRPRPEGARTDGERRPRPEGMRPDAGRKAAPDKVKKGAKNKEKAPKEKKKSSVGKIILLVVELAALIAMGVFLYFVLTATKSGKVELPEKDIYINEEVKQKIEMTSNNKGNSGSKGEEGTPEEGEEETSGGSSMAGYRNIALFGVDSREGALTKNTRTDTIMIASVNEATGDVKLVSVYRDTYLNLSNDQYNKCNAAYAKGGPKQAINMLNMNLDMNITDFVTIGFDGLIKVIDAMGGVEVNVLESEIVHLNNYQISMVGKTTDGETFTANAGSDYTPVKAPGRQVLNGLQATAYCRIRYVGNDFQRAERQRTVIMALLDKAKANPAKLPSIAESMFSKVYTSLDLSEIISLLGNVTDYTIVDQAGFPQTEKLAVGNIGPKGSCVVPISLEENVSWLHEFLFGDEGYEPSSMVKTCSDKVRSDTSPYL